MVVFTASTTLRSKVTGFTSGRGSTQTVTARAHTLTHAHTRTQPLPWCLNHADRRDAPGANGTGPFPASPFQRIQPVTTASTGDMRRLSSSDPSAVARTSRSWDIISSPDVTKAWRTIFARHATEPQSVPATHFPPQANMVMKQTVITALHQLSLLCTTTNVITTWNRFAPCY